MICLRPRDERANNATTQTELNVPPDKFTYSEHALDSVLFINRIGNENFEIRHIGFQF